MLLLKRSKQVTQSHHSASLHEKNCHYYYHSHFCNKRFFPDNRGISCKRSFCQIFKWEVAGLTDSLSTVFHDKLQVWGTSGDPVSKTAYLQRLSSPDFIHNKVTIEKSTAVNADNTAILNGDGIFDLTISGNKTNLHLL